MYWTPVEEAASYEIYQVNADGTRSLIMETPSTAYYIPTLNWDGLAAAVNLEVVPVNGNGIRVRPVCPYHPLGLRQRGFRED